MYQRLYAVSLRLEALGLTHIKNQNMLLRQLAGQYAIDPLKNLVNVIAPVTGYQRDKHDHYRVYSPLSSIADAATADPWTAIQFHWMVERFVRNPDPDLEEDIRSDLIRWRRSDPALEALIDASPDLHAVRPVARSLAKLARIGIRALNNYDRKRQPSKQWVKHTTSAFIQARQPAAKVTLQIVDEVEKLVILAEQAATPASNKTATITKSEARPPI
jgi:hexosaminidase